MDGYLHATTTYVLLVSLFASDPPERSNGGHGLAS